ncbi:MAG: PAS domain S-box protein [Deltaproteobacteria bacterium]|nr:PAS domain S-box protein [Deltaproteobacteria bacterium]
MLFLAAPDLLCIVGADGTLKRTNPAWSRILGYRETELVGVSFAELVHPDDAQLAGVRGDALDVRMRCKDGSYRWISFRHSAIPGSEETLCAGRDVTACKMAVRSVEEQLHTIIHHVPIVLFAFDRQGVFTLSEGRGLAALGLRPRELLGKSVLDVYSDQPQVLASVRRAMMGEQFVAHVELVPQSFHYDVLYVPTHGENGELTGVLGVAVDVTEQKRAETAVKETEQRLLEADRLAALGTLAAGVAHEINNPLTYALLNLNLLGKEISKSVELPEESAITKLIDEVREGVERVGVIVRDLRAFSRADSEPRSEVDVIQVLESTLHMASGEIRHRARLSRNYGEVPKVQANGARLSQVFLNLLVNAVQAIAEGNPDQHEIQVTARTAEGGFALVEVKDTGEGIPPHLLERIFDPFFTTKPVGVGTGLGLSICRGILNSLGGRIEVVSEVGRGTTFRVVLPPGPTGAEHASLRSGSTVPARERAVGRRGRVLVIDDEPAIARALCRVLEPLHDVVSASSGREALEILGADGSFDVIFCDLMMSEMSGIDMHSALLESDPALAERVIFMTGGTFTRKTREFLAHLPNRFIDKPFDLSKVQALVQARVKSAPVLT